MIRKLVAASLGATLVLGLAACAEMDEPVEPTVADSELSISLESTLVEGTLQFGDSLVEFYAEEVDEMVFDLQVYVNGMGFDAIMDREGGVAGLDGFAEDNGEDTQVLEEDRMALMALYRRLNDDYEGVANSDLPPAFIALRRTVGNWAQQPTSIDMTRTVMGEDDRTIIYLCSYAYCGSWTGSCSYWNYYYDATHDGECYNCSWGFCDGDRHDDRTSQRPQLGDHYSCSSDDNTWTMVNGAWTCSEQDHMANPNEVGTCFGRSGASCGGDTQYTLDPTDHDGCVRNGHALASMWCNDEFASASDDELFGDDCY